MCIYISVYTIIILFIKYNIFSFKSGNIYIIFNEIKLNKHKHIYVYFNGVLICLWPLINNIYRTPSYFGNSQFNTKLHLLLIAFFLKCRHIAHLLSSSLVFYQFNIVAFIVAPQL